MTDNPNPTTPTAAPAAPPQVRQRIIAQFIRDMSFENVLSQKGSTGEIQPEINVQVGIDARKRPADGQFDVITKLTVTSKSKGTGDVIFMLEIEYVGVFQIEGVPEDQMYPYLMIECPRITFPFLRRIVSDVTRDGGFPPLNLEMIDFVQIYRAEMNRRIQAQQAAAAAPKLDS